MAVTTHLRSFQALELAVRVGSLKGAADVLSISPAAVGQRIKALEDYLGTDLLVRGRSGLRPSPALETALKHLGTAFRELAQAADILDMQRGHEIHIAAVSDFADLWLQPRLDSFRSAHPNIQFHINGEGAAQPRLRPLDCKISFGPRSDSTNSVQLFHDFLLPISSPENTRRVGELKKRDRLEGFPLLHLDLYKEDPAAPGWSDWIKLHKLKRTMPNRGIRFQRIVPTLDAVLANAGFAICGLALISRYIDDGRVSLPFPINTGAWTGHAFQASFRNEALVRPQVRRFRSWLLEESALTNAWLKQRTTQARSSSAH